ncbi:hypothetical protein ABK040_011492 [Willaertia magna]
METKLLEITTATTTTLPNQRQQQSTFIFPLYELKDLYFKIFSYLPPKSIGTLNSICSFFHNEIIPNYKSFQKARAYHYYFNSTRTVTTTTTTTPTTTTITENKKELKIKRNVKHCPIYAIEKDSNNLIYIYFLFKLWKKGLDKAGYSYFNLPYKFLKKLPFHLLTNIDFIISLIEIGFNFNIFKIYSINRNEDLFFKKMMEKKEFTLLYQIYENCKELNKNVKQKIEMILPLLNKKNLENLENTNLENLFFIKKEIDKSHLALKYIPLNLKENLEIINFSLQKSPFAFEYLPKVQTDYNISKQIVMKELKMISFVKNEILLNDLNFYFEIIKLRKNLTIGLIRRILKVAPKKLIPQIVNNPEINCKIFETIYRNPYCLGHLSEYLNDGDIENVFYSLRERFEWFERDKESLFDKLVNGSHHSYNELRYNALYE